MPAMVEYVSRNSFIHRLNPITKIAWTLAILIICFIFDDPLAIFTVFVSNIAVAAASGVLKNVLPVIKGLFLFSLLLILFQIFFVTEGETLFYVIPYFNIGRVTDVGLKLSLVLSLRMITTVSTIPILMMTTPMTDIVAVLVEKFKIPFNYAFMFITALRFIPTFMGEMEQILQAQMSRGYSSDTRNPLKKLFIVIPLAVPLLVSSVKKTEKIAISMETRGFGSGPRSHYRKIAIKGSDYMVLLVLATAVLGSIVLVY